MHLTAAVIELMTRAIGRIYIIPNDSVQGVIPHSNTQHEGTPHERALKRMGILKQKDY